MSKALSSGLTKRFGGLTALNGIDMSVDSGEMLGLIGPNGSGKTTLLNIISGYYEACRTGTPAAPRRSTGRTSSCATSSSTRWPAPGPRASRAGKASCWNSRAS